MFTLAPDKPLRWTFAQRAMAMAQLIPLSLCLPIPMSGNARRRQQTGLNLHRPKHPYPQATQRYRLQPRRLQ